MLKKVADYIFKLFCHKDYWADICGDLEEIHNHLLSKYPSWLAQLIYTKEVILLFRISLIRPLNHSYSLIPVSMFRNYFMISMRHLRKNRAHSFINISGLTIGLVCCLLIILYIRDELSYDRHHEKAERIYRVNSHSEIGGNERHWALAPASVGPALKEHLPEVETFTRLATLSKSQQLIDYSDKTFDASVNGGPYGRVFWADSNFFDVFSHPVIMGNLSQSLSRPNTVVITERSANKIFSDESPLGKVLEFSNLGNFEVTAVIGNVSSNSHLQFDYLLSNSFEPIPPPQGLFWSRVYITVYPQTDMALIEEKIDSVGRQAEINMLKNGVKMDYFTAPVTDLHLTSGLEYELYPTSDIRYIYIFSAISIFILLIASINFINLSTAQLARRAKEVGVRKVMGAGRGQMVAQFLVQSVFITLLSAVLSLILTYPLLDGFNQFAQKELSISTMLSWQAISVYLGITVIIGVVAGLYPALVMSAFSPVTALKENLKPQSASQWLRKFLVIFQFSISVILIAATFIIIQQLYYMKEVKLGFNQDQVLTITVDRNQSYSNLTVLKNRILGLGGANKATLSSGGPGKHTNVMVMMPEGFTQANSQRMDGIYADFDFVGAYGLELIAGRDFDPKKPSDSLNFIINRTAANKMGWTIAETIGKELEYPGNTPSAAPGKKGRIIGVVEDFHYQSLHNKIGPLLIGIHSSNFPLLGLNLLSVKLEASVVSNALVSIEQIWEDLYPQKPLSYAFVNSAFERQYESEERLSQMISAFAVLGIFIACLGLFGLALFITQQRTKEIGIRKVLGATIVQIASKLSLGFITLVLIGNLVAWPVTYFFLKDWLAGFAYHIDISFMVFVAAGLCSLLIAVLTIGYQTLKAAASNPVNSLRYE